MLETIPGQSQAVAEMVWDATVATMNAGDPEHAVSHHFAPNQQWSFRQAAQRIANLSLTLSELESCLDNNQNCCIRISTKATCLSANTERVEKKE